MEYKRGIHGLIVGKTYDTALEKASRLIREYELTGIAVDDYLKFKDYSTIIFENGDYWTVSGIDISPRGRQINIAYIDKDIEREIVEIIILPQVKGLPYRGYNYF